MCVVVTWWSMLIHVRQLSFCMESCWNSLLFCFCAPCHGQVKLFGEKRSDLEDQQLHLNVGLNKIRETEQQVSELKSSLAVKKQELEEKNSLANQKLKQMVSFVLSCTIEA